MPSSVATGACNWPDPDPAPGMPRTDDVARMNSQHVDRIFHVRTAEDIKHVLALAQKHGKPVSMRGTRHSMGGQTITAGGFVIDLLHLTRWSFDPH
jgi:FAD/FMN-containing dehydrogenase